MVKRVAISRGTLTVTSDNPAADAVPAGDVVVIGRVVWQMREPD
jgi:phage repressor protein C with HTH and peptisase S24 domain